MLQGLNELNSSITSDDFVTTVQAMDTSELLAARTHVSGLLETEPTGNFRSKLRGHWMLGVYDRELKARNQ